jgi:hypothetical protein
MTLEEIGALLGFVAFGGLAVLVFLTFQQARHLRRLREWAGRGPERAAAIDAQRSEPEAEGEAAPGAERSPRFAGVREAAAARWAELDRRLPVDPRLLFGGLAAILIGVAIATGGFGLLGSDDGSGASERGRNAARNENRGGGGNRGGGSSSEVAVLNATAPPGGTGTAGIADRLSGEVESADFEVGEVGNAGSFSESVVMWRAGAESEAEELADALAGVLGETGVAEMTPEIESLAGDADIALVIGQDDAGV